MSDYLYESKIMCEALLKGEEFSPKEFCMKYEDIDKEFLLKKLGNQGGEINTELIDGFCVDVKRTIQAREDAYKCQKFVDEFECRYNDFLNLIFDQSIIKNQFLLEYYEYLENIDSFDDYIMLEGYLHYMDYNPCLISGDELNYMTEQVEHAIEAMNKGHYCKCLIELLLYSINPTKSGEKQLVNSIRNALDETNKSALWGMHWGLEVRNFELLEKIQIEYDTVVEQKLSEHDEVTLDDLNKYSSIAYSIALFKAYIIENKELIELAANVLGLIKKEIDICDIYQLDLAKDYVETNEERLFFEGAIKYVLLKRYLAIIDILYHILNLNGNEDELYERFADELYKIRQEIIPLLKRMSVRKYEKDDITKGIENYAKNSLRSLEVIAYRTLIFAISSGNIEQLMNAKRELNSLYATCGDDFAEIDRAIEFICGEIWNFVERESGVEFYQKTVRSMLLHYGFSDNDYGFIKALSTAEYLYSQYMVPEKINEDFDYSFISIMYYTALENLTNELLYAPYALFIENRINNSNIGEYLTDRRAISSNCFFRKGKLKKQVELGVLGILLENSRNIIKFQDYLIHQKGLDKKKVNDIIQLGKRMNKAAENRNKAAHGSERIDDKAAQRDKSIVYDYELIETYKGLIAEFLNIMKK